MAILSQDIGCSSTLGIESTVLPIGSYLGDPSRLAFTVKSTSGIAVSQLGLLDWSSLSPAIVPVGIPNQNLSLPTGGQVVRPFGKDASPRTPFANETAILLPNGLVISPHQFIDWDFNADAGKPVHIPTTITRKFSSTTELFEARALVSPGFIEKNPSSAIEDLRTLRAVATSEVPAEIECRPGSTGCNNNGLDLLPTLSDRSGIVNLSSNFSKDIDGNRYEPNPLQFSDLRLSSLGGSVKMRGNWPHNAPNRPNEFGNVVAYEHQTTQGRDQYVRVERYYYACPIPVVVILIQERMRRFLPGHKHSDPNQKGHAAIILEKWYSKHIPIEDFELINDGELLLGRRWPFRSVHFEWPNELELKRPVDIIDPMMIPTDDDPASPGGLYKKQLQSCWMYPVCSDKPVQIPTTTVDWQGNRQSFQMPLLLIRPDIATSEPEHENLKKSLEKYHEAVGLRDVEFGGQTLGLVPMQENATKDQRSKGAFPTNRIRFGVERPDNSWFKSEWPEFGNLDETVAKNKPTTLRTGWPVQYYPAIRHAQVRIRELEAYSTTSDSTTRITWNPIYTAIGFDTSNNANSGQLFADVVNPVVDDANEPNRKISIGASKLGFDHEKGGGLVSPSVDVRSFSRSIGVVGYSSPSSTQKADTTTYPKSDCTESNFNPSQFLPMDAKIIGGIKLKDVLGAVRALSDAPQLQNKEIADIKAAFDEVAEVATEIAKIATAVRSVQSQISQSVNTVRKVVEGDLVEDIRRILTRPFEHLSDTLPRLLELDQDSIDGLSIPKTILILSNSIKNKYAKVDTNEAIRELNNLLTPDRLIRDIRSRPLSVLQNEFAKLDIVNGILSPQNKIDRLVKLVQNPDNFLDGLFFDEVRGVLNDLGLGGNGLIDTVKARVGAFSANLQRAIHRVIGEICDVVEKNAISATRDFFAEKDGGRQSWNLAIDPTQSPEAAKRLGLHEDFLVRRIRNPMVGIANSALMELAEFFDSFQKWSDIEKALQQISSVFKEVGKNLGDSLSVLEGLVGKMPKSVTASFEWDTELTDGPASFPIFVASNPLRGNKRAKLSLKSSIEKKLGFTKQSLLSKPTARVDVRVTDFRIVLIPNAEFITVTFDELALSSDGQSKPKVTVEIADVKFGKSLEFVQKLTALFNQGNGLSIDVSKLGLSARYGFMVPAFSLGAFNMMNLSLGIGVVLPFDGSPIGIEFSVSTKANPCLISVGIFGGHAFFRIILQPNENKGVSVRQLEAELAFGIVAPVNFGPAEGVLEVVGGIYYSRTGDELQFRGFILAKGELDVLSLITASVVFYLGLEYSKEGSETSLYGIAEVTISVEIAFVINTSVSVTYKQKLQGSKSEDERLTNRSSKTSKLLGPMESREVTTELPSKVPLSTAEWATYNTLFA